MGNYIGCRCPCPCLGEKTKDAHEPKDMAGSSDLEGNEGTTNETPIDIPIPPLFPIENEDQIPPHHGPIKQLYANGYNLSIETDGTVRGTEEHYSKWAILEISSPGPAEVRIKGVESQLYLAMDENGELYGSADGQSDDTIFLEQYYDRYLYYLSKKYADRNWYVGIKKSGRPKNGKKTAKGQNATKFLPRQAKPPS
ncbi:fibroblast growth factor 1-like isoform X1 [Centruroides vittatus]|uniref:fibroblast growth factor 1-like isoform X1 n=2 Tax=Centruroides vittatus TaxID=120091 RepID=UPI00350FBAD7